MAKSKKEKYIIQSKEYYFREKYSFGDWQKVIKFLQGVNPDDVMSMVSIILDESKIIPLLNIIVSGDNPLPETLYESDFEEVNRAIQDFFLRKESLIRLSAQSLPK